MVTGGANLGRIGIITNRERHPGSFDVVHVKDSTGNSFATRLSNIFVIGKVSKFKLVSVLLLGRFDEFPPHLKYWVTLSLINEFISQDSLGPSVWSNDDH